MILQYLEKSLKQTVVLTDDFKNYKLNVKVNTDLYPINIFRKLWSFPYNWNMH